MDIVGVGFIVDGVKDLFPGADRQALQCCAELMDKDRKALAAEITALRKRVGELEGDSHFILDLLLAHAPKRITEHEDVVKVRLKIHGPDDALRAKGGGNV